MVENIVAKIARHVAIISGESATTVLYPTSCILRTKTLIPGINVANWNKVKNIFPKGDRKSKIDKRRAIKKFAKKGHQYSALVERSFHTKYFLQ